MSAARQWYYSSDGTSKTGPLTDQQLLAAVKEKVVLPETLVWHAQLSGWIAAARIKALFPNARQQAAPTPSQHTPIERPANPASHQAAAAAPPRKQSKRWRAAVALAVVTIVAGSYAFRQQWIDELAAMLRGPETSSVPASAVLAPTGPIKLAKLPPPAPLTDEERRRLALAAIDELAAHPDDPHRPQNVAGVTDDALRETSLAEIAALLEHCTSHAYDHHETPRYLFALGRAALLHGMDSRAERLLTDAAEGGSAPAHAYLAFLTDDPREAAGRLNLAVIRGFLPAKAWLGELGDPAEWAHAEGEGRQSEGPSAPEKETEDVAIAFSYDRFKRPELIEAFHTGHFDILPRKNGLTFAYILGFLEAFNDTSSMPTLSADGERKLHSLQNPKFVYQASLTIAGNEEFLGEAMEHTFGSFVGIMKGVADVRRRGGSLQEETAAAMRGAEPVSRVDIAKAEGRHDAQALGFLVAANFSDAKQVMDGMTSFIVRVGNGERFGASKETSSGSFGGVPTTPSRGSGRGSQSTLPGVQSGRESR